MKLNFYNLAVIMIVLAVPTLTVLSVIKSKIGLMMGFSLGVIIGVWVNLIPPYFVTILVLAIVGILFSEYSGTGGGGEV